MLTILTSFALSMAVAAMDDSVAAPGADPTASTGEKAKEDKSKRVCRTIVVSGTRRGQRVCRTKESWDADVETTRRYVEDGQLNGAYRDGSNNGAGMVGGPR